MKVQALFQFIGATPYHERDVSIEAVGRGKYRVFIDGKLVRSAMTSNQLARWLLGVVRQRDSK